MALDFKMASLSKGLRPGSSGLSHLFEAATALTALVEKAHSNDVEAVVSDDDEQCSKKVQPKAGKKKETFPEKLMEILTNETLSDIVSWLPHGRSFVIMRPDIFTNDVLPKYLPPVDARMSTKYPSFTRKLNRWGFRQATRGPDTGAFHHPLFRKDQPELCLKMVCQKSRERQPSPRRALPPKKRAVSDSTKPAPSEEPEVVSDSSNAYADDRSISSNTNSAISSLHGNEFSSSPVSIVSGTDQEHGVALPFISNDAKFVAKALQERSRNEVLNAARAMLYDAYMKAAAGKTL